MDFEMLANEQILSVETPYGRPPSVVHKKHHGMNKLVEIAAVKRAIMVDEELAISLKWKTFSFVEEDWIYSALSLPFKVRIFQVVNREEALKQEGDVESAGGAGEFLFSSTEPGVFMIRTANSNVDNGHLEVTVDVA